MIQWVSAVGLVTVSSSATIDDRDGPNSGFILTTTTWLGWWWSEDKFSDLSELVGSDSKRKGFTSCYITIQCMFDIRIIMAYLGLIHTVSISPLSILFSGSMQNYIDALHTFIKMSVHTSTWDSFLSFCSFLAFSNFALAFLNFFLFLKPVRYSLQR